MTSEEQRAGAAQRVHDLLAELVAIVGPQATCGEPDCECSGVVTSEEPNFVLSEWVLCMVWTDLSDGDSYNTKLNTANMLRTHQRGLLLDWVDTLAP